MAGLGPLASRSPGSDLRALANPDTRAGADGTETAACGPGKQMDARSRAQTLNARGGRRNSHWAHEPGKVNMACAAVCMGDAKRNFNFPPNTADWPFPASQYHLLTLRSFKIARDFLKILD